MGQYYESLIIDEKTIEDQPGKAIIKKEIFLKYELESRKLTEHSWVNNSEVNNVLLYILNNPCKIAWVGDYADETYDAYEKAKKSKPLSEDEYFDIYNAVYSDNAGAKKLNNPCNEKYNKEKLQKLLLGKKKKYLINHTINEYFEIGKYIEKNDRNGWCLHPLPILTACGNGQGGGDYISPVGQEDVGKWAYDLIEFSYDLPGDNYQEVVYFFVD